jgi:hypothetical protein
MVVVKGVQYTLPTLRIPFPGYTGSCGRYISQPVADVRLYFFNASEVEPVTLNVTIEIRGDGYPAASRSAYGRKNLVLTLNKQGVSAVEEEVPLREDMLSAARSAARWSKFRAVVTVASSRSEPITLWSQPVAVDMEEYQSYLSNEVWKNNQISEANGCAPPPSPVQSLPEPVVTPQPAPSRPRSPSPVQPLPRPVRISPVNPVPLRRVP